MFIIDARDSRAQIVKNQNGALEPILLTLKIPELLCNYVKEGVEVALDVN